MTESGPSTHSPSLRLDAARIALADLIERYCPGDGPNPTPVPGLSLFRASSTSTPMCTIYRSLLAIAAQGTKRLNLADETFQYDSRHYLITSVDLPVMGHITEASPERPYLCAVFDMDTRKIGDLAGTLQLPPPLPGSGSLGLGVSPLTDTVMDAVLRLVRLLDTPEVSEKALEALHNDKKARLLRLQLEALAEHALPKLMEAGKMLRSLRSSFFPTGKPLSSPE